MTFKAGESGNPSGRPKDRTPATAIRQAIVNDAPRIVQTLIDLALQGDVQAARCLIDKICPSLKAVAPVVTIPDSSGMSLAQRGDTIIQAVLNGSVAPDVGVMLLNGLAAQGRIIEVQELEARLTHLESIMEKRT